MTTVHLGGDLTFDTTFPQRFQVLVGTDDGVEVVRSTPSQSTARNTYERLTGTVRWLLDRDDLDDHVIATTFVAVHIPDELPEPVEATTVVTSPKPPRRRIEHDLDDPAHGTTTGYRAHQCRCVRCKAANTEALRLYRQSKRK